MDQLLSPILAATGVLGLFGASGTVLVQLLRQNARLNEQMNNSIARLQEENQRCNLRVSVLVSAMRKAGVEIPDWVNGG